MISMRGGTVGLRFTVLYAAVFLMSGIGLLMLTYLFAGFRVSDTVPSGDHPPPVPAGAQQRIRELQDQLAEVNAQHSRQLLVGSLVALMVMAMVSVLVGQVLAGRVLRPLRLITAATRQISAESLDRRLAVTGPADEVKELANTIDDLLERLEMSFVAQRRFVAHASHELRTPLTIMRASLDVALAKPQPAEQAVALAGRLRTELDRVDHLLDGLLALARAQHAGFVDREPVELGDVVSQAVNIRAAEVAAKKLSVQEEMRPGVRAWGNRALLARMVQNVIDNAVIHNLEGGHIRIGTSEDGDGARLVVATGGPVLEQTEVDRLTRPFERLGADRTGSEDSPGLGLSIVDAVVEAHGGRLELRARPEGGLGVRIVLPSVAAPVEATA